MSRETAREFVLLWLGPRGRRFQVGEFSKWRKTYMTSIAWDVWKVFEELKKAGRLFNVSGPRGAATEYEWRGW